MRNWIVRNQSMVNEAGGVLAGLAQKRVEGKPHLCTEYNHAAPNTYSSEAPLLLAAYAGLQDWDGLFLFSYSHRSEWDTRKIRGFFDIDQHPLKMANLAVAAAMFRRGDVSPANRLVTAPITPQREVALVAREKRNWRLADAGMLGMPGPLALVHRVGLRRGGPPAGDMPPAPRADQPLVAISMNP